MKILIFSQNPLFINNPRANVRKFAFANKNGVMGEPLVKKIPQRFYFKDLNYNDLYGKGYTARGIGERDEFRYDFNGEYDGLPVYDGSWIGEELMRWEIQIYPTYQNVTKLYFERENKLWIELFVKPL